MRPEAGPWGWQGPRYAGRRVGPDADAWKRGRGWELRVRADAAASAVRWETLAAAVEVLEMLIVDGWRRKGYRQTDVQIAAGAAPNFGVVSSTEIARAIGHRVGGDGRAAGIAYLETLGLVRVTKTQSPGAAGGRPVTLIALTRPPGSMAEARADLVSDVICAKYPPGSRVTAFELGLVLPPRLRHGDTLRGLMELLASWGDCRTDPAGVDPARADAWIMV